MTGYAVKLAAEGKIDLAVLRRLAADAGLDTAEEYGQRGKNHLDQRLSSYNLAAQFAPWIVLRDLDHDEMCAGDLVAKLLPQPSPYIRLRIAVRSVETWLLADWLGLTSAFAIKTQTKLLQPDTVTNPKREMLAILLQSSSREIRQAMVRGRPGQALDIGPEYNARLSAFVATDWTPHSASTASASLQRALARIDEFAIIVKQTWST